MVSFKEYILEYASKQQNLYFGPTKLKAKTKIGFNGKDPDNVYKRKHANTQAKEFQHKNPIIHSISKGIANNIALRGKRLLGLLTMYGIDFKPGDTKVIGNSNVEVDMSIDPNGHQVGIFKNRDKNNGM